MVRDGEYYGKLIPIHGIRGSMDRKVVSKIGELVKSLQYQFPSLTKRGCVMI
ncbi:MAG: hypothetical protein UX65_C0006G0017 [Parcubacteria group bacterium GW2011_GWB1_46_8]|nr:MAG: hypothetical protein UX14_C0007G0022 [Parcubacteria group bacterium GW2011_GWF1_45_5]KKU46252.1 MAG: hypothetical protein UX65_C0006G0017 [Parcubacteria group bacterium GW2011_GWB1_46_8]